jgi:iron(III) transport system substrate-binding protein
MKRKTKTALLAALPLLAHLLFAGTTHAQDLVIGGETLTDEATIKAARAEGEVTLYGTYPSDLMNPILAAFKADTGILPTYLRLTSQIMFPRVTSEFAAHRLAADYVDLTDPTLARQLVEQGVLAAPFKIANFDRLPPALRDAQGRWYALIRPVGVLGVNTELVSPADVPKRWADMLDPKFTGQIGLPSIEVGGSAFILFVFLKQRLGDAFWTKLAAQLPHIYPSSAPTEQDLVRGETSLALDTTALLAQIRQGAAVRVVFPSEGIPAFPISGGITASAPHPHAARVFIAWMASLRGAAAIGNTGAYGINPDAPAPHPDNITFPPAKDVWNMPPDQWEQIRTTETAQWHQVFSK